VGVAALEWEWHVRVGVACCSGRGIFAVDCGR